MNPVITGSAFKHFKIVDDGVMGGKSAGYFKINAKGNGEFYGHVSLENNGGFSSVRYQTTVHVNANTSIMLHIKGDGKRYQIRVKESADQKESFVNYFTTSGAWQTVTIHLKDLYPKFRGKHLDSANFSGTKISEIGFLIGNKKAEPFNLEIAKIEFTTI